MPYFITTLHILIEADSIEAAREVRDVIEETIEEFGGHSETADLPSGPATLIEVESKIQTDPDELSCFDFDLNRISSETRDPSATDDAG